jgi:hypothetical protein
MAGLDPAIHVFTCAGKKDVDARHKAGHDEIARIRALIARNGLILRDGAEFIIGPRSARTRWRLLRMSLKAPS